MNSLNKITFDILELLKGYQLSDDMDIDERQIHFHINTQRALIIREMLKNGGKLDTSLIQDLGCIQITEVEASECCDVDTNCYVLRTVNKLPQFIETDGNNGITRIGPVKKLSRPFSFIPYSQFVYSGESKYNKNMIFSTLYNGYIYFKSNDPANELLGVFNIAGVLEDPTDAKNYNRCAGNEVCYTNDQNYPINGWMIPIIKDRVMRQLLGSLQIPKDTSNDAKDNVDTNNKN